MYRTSNSRGFTLVEMAIVMIIVGLLAGVAFPMVSMLLKKGESERERAALTEAKEALLGHVLTNSGLPGPNAFADDSRTHVARDVNGRPERTVAGVPGALPSDRLGIGSRGTGNTLLLYDVHPALRSDLEFSFDPDSLVLHEPDYDLQGTDGSMLRLCRNLNTLIYIENDPDGIYGPTPDLHRFQYLLPRIWDSTSFSDDEHDHLRERSAAAAFVVVSRAQQSYASLDRQNSYDDPYDYVTGLLDQRVYENPATLFNQDIDCDQHGDRTDANTCYENQVLSVSLVELRQHLHRAGYCADGISKYRNDEVILTVSNFVTRSVVTGSVPTGDYHCVDSDGDPLSYQTEPACKNNSGHWGAITNDISSNVPTSIWYRFFHTDPTVGGNYSPQELCTSIAPGATVTLTTEVYDLAEDAWRGISFFIESGCDVGDLIEDYSQLLVDDPAVDSLWFTTADLSSGDVERHVTCSGEIEDYECARN